MRDLLDGHLDADLDDLDASTQHGPVLGAPRADPRAASCGRPTSARSWSWRLRPAPAAQPVRPPRRGAGVLDELETALDPDVLTIGFARRFATYKRAGLLFSDIDRLARLLWDEDRPVQIVFAGKAHPADRPGQQVIQEIFQRSRSPELRGRVFILEDYDMRVARFLVQGVDVWLNNPRRPLEASGTCGMKAALNGVLNVSVLDGWWDEGYDRRQRLGHRRPRDEPGRGRPGLGGRAGPLPAPRGGGRPALLRARRERRSRCAGSSVMRRAMASAIWRFSTTRMLHEYVERLYLPAAGVAVAETDGRRAGRHRGRLSDGPPVTRAHLAGPRDPQPPAGRQLRLGLRRDVRPGVPADARGARAPSGRPPVAPLHGTAAGVAAGRAPGLHRAAAGPRRPRAGRDPRRRLLRAGPRVAPEARPRRPADPDGATSSSRCSAGGRAARGSPNASGSRTCPRRWPTAATRGRSSTTPTSARRPSPRRTSGARTPPRTRARS